MKSIQLLRISKEKHSLATPTTEQDAEQKRAEGQVKTVHRCLEKSASSQPGSDLEEVFEAITWRSPASVKVDYFEGLILDLSKPV